MFFITAIVSDEKFRRNSRTFGYATDLQTAVGYVNRNVGSMCESLYDYIVIEEIGPGIHPEAKQVGWFKWEHPNWMMCGRPDEFANVVNWAIG